MLPGEVEFVLELTSMQGSEVYYVLTGRGAIEKVNVIFSFCTLCSWFFVFLQGRKNVRPTQLRPDRSCEASKKWSTCTS